MALLLQIAALEKHCRISSAMFFCFFTMSPSTIPCGNRYRPFNSVSVCHNLFQITPMKWHVNIPNPNLDAVCLRQLPIWSTNKITQNMRFMSKEAVTCLRRGPIVSTLTRSPKQDLSMPHNQSNMATLLDEVVVTLRTLPHLHQSKDHIFRDLCFLQILQLCGLSFA